MSTNPREHAGARVPWLSRPNALAALVVLLAILLRNHSFLSLDGAIVEHDWYTLHQVDAMHIELAAREGAPIPFWSPWILGGTPLFAVPTKPFSYPPFVLGVLALGPSLAMNLLLLVHLFIGGFGTVLLVRRLGLQGIAPVVCGALFVLTRFPAIGFQATPFGFGWAVAWWPYTLIVLLDLLEGPRRLRAGAWLGVLLATQWHAGGEVSLYWIGCFSTAFALPWLARRWNWDELRALLLSSTIALFVFFGLAAVKLLPTLAWLGSSGRAQELGVEFARDSALEAHLIESGAESRLATFGVLLWRTYAGSGAWVLGALVLFGAIAGARRRTWLALLAGTLFCYVLASGALHDWAYEVLPGYDRMRRHTRFAHVVGFGAILLAGHGLQLRIAREATTRARAVRALLVCLLGAYILFDTQSLPGVNLATPTLKSASERRALTSTLLAPVLADPRRSRLHHEGNREQPTWIDLGIESTSGALGGPRSGNALYTELLPERASPETLEATARGVLDVLNVRYVASYTEIARPHLEIVASPGDLDADQLARLHDWSVEPFYLLRRSTARERACLVDGATLVVGESALCERAIAEHLRSPAFDAHAGVLVDGSQTRPGHLHATDAAGFGAVLFLDLDARDPVVERWLREVPGGALQDAPGGGTLWTRGAALAPTRIEALDASRFTKSMESIDVDVSGASATFLLVAEVLTLHPGWVASIDGKPASMLRADGLATLVRLPEGARKVSFRFRAPGFALGASISAITLLLLGCAWIAARRRPPA